ncbi:MAG: PstS family phosphate ABC transporter substrate-binding protein [Candidatus Bipolaricaulota bacterium]
MNSKSLLSFFIAVLLLAGMLSGGMALGAEPEPLRAGGSSTVYPIANLAASYWNANPPAEDGEYWGPEQYGIETELNLADYWCNQYGLDTFGVQVGLSHTGVGLKKLSKGQIDLANSSAAVRFELPDSSEEELEKYVDHVVARDHQAFSVSREIYEAGVEVLTKEQIVDIFKGEITNWQEVEGPDREIQVIGRAVGSGTETMFRINVFGKTDVDLSGVDVREGQNQRVRLSLQNSNNGIGYPGVDFVGEENPAIDVIWDDENRYSVEDSGWPLARELHMYTYETTSKKEAAFLRMIISDFGQENFLGDYYPLSEDQQEEELEKLDKVKS